jgi:ATP-dependent Lon protease
LQDTLLEVLDPQQNHEFRDNFLEAPLDLSKVLFICTANLLETISPPVLDRLEVIELSGYTTEEKMEIAKTHLIPKALEKAGIEDFDVDFTHQGLKSII